MVTVKDITEESKKKQNLLEKKAKFWEEKFNFKDSKNHRFLDYLAFMTDQKVYALLSPDKIPELMEVYAEIPLHTLKSWGESYEQIFGGEIEIRRDLYKTD